MKRFKAPNTDMISRELWSIRDGFLEGRWVGEMGCWRVEVFDITCGLTEQGIMLVELVSIW
jgi:hypothetical protein